ncbi:MAG: adenine-specific methyltransferase EcoRI family protein [Planctomycetaceae bacterium]|nr:adenine-specific methyltransferase EcoRI family protein [Planctomycetaceae bacterium]
MAKRAGNTSFALNSAKRAKNDEFYTQMTDIEKEVWYYRSQFKGKVIFCNCDAPYESDFFKYFALNFNFFGLKKLIAACYAGSPIANTELSLFEYEPAEDRTTRAPHKIEIAEVEDYNGDSAVNSADVENLLRNKKNVLTRLNGDGDFRSQECIELLKQADIVVTNPPFSLFREYVAQLMEYKKEFLIIGNVNAISYQEIFPLIRDNKLWLGESIHSGDRAFRVPDYYPLSAVGCGVDENGHRFIRVKGVRWFTNIQVTKSKRYDMLPLYKQYNPKKYPKYDNYDAIEVSKAAEIPADYDGAMGVPITFLDKYNPNQFVIIGLAAGGYNREIVGLEKNPDIKDARPLINGKNTYARIFICKKAEAQSCG